MNSTYIRKSFLDFFASKKHQIVPSAPMVIKNDPSLMFTNAGMNPFKDIFLGNETIKYPRIANTQKCLRVSGKHNDLEEVGRDTYHHTLFEMLGNWSFNDYFKKEAIAWAWEYLHTICNIPQENMYVTVFGGDSVEGLEKDTEAYELWKAFVPEDRILLGSKKDNFWEMGEQGPCGPSSEIHVDIRPEEEKKKIDGKDLVNRDHPQVIEIWNLVFIQYNRLANGSLQVLTNKHIDTGMGFERLCMVLQKKQSNYDTDVFQPLIQSLAGLAGKEYGKEEQVDIAMRVCVDHIRAIAFTIADGQLPSNAKAGYVIRRILRRAIRYGYTFLGFKEPFMHLLVPVLSTQMGEVFPELKAQKELITKVILEEEQGFLRTLENGIHKFEQYTAKREKESLVEGSFAFELFDTYGFPLDLTQLMASEKGLQVDLVGFDQELEKQRARSRNDAQVSTEDWVEVKSGGQSEFVGYDLDSTPLSILRYRKVSSKGNTFYHLVFDKTPFYAEAGGQIGDSGYIESQKEKILIINTKKENNLSIHITQSLPSEPGLSFMAFVDVERRRKVEMNHSATHLLHLGLRQVLGSHVEQKGSMVDDKRLRFDFSHFAKLSKEEIRQVEQFVNEQIRKNIPLEEFRSLDIKEAEKMGAMALFGEKYGEKVRVIRFGTSTEFCGGTHVKATGCIGMLKILSESANAAGIRRIEACTASQVEEMIYQSQDQNEEIKNLLNTSQSDLTSLFQKLLEENHNLKEKMLRLEEAQVVRLKQRCLASFSEEKGISIYADLNDLSPEVNKNAAYQLRGEKERKPFALVLCSSYEDKPSLSILLSDCLVAKGLNAAKIVREAAKEIGGGGGGQAFFATAGGKKLEGLNAALHKAMELIMADC